MEKRGFVYIVTNKAFGTLYIGVTSDLVKRVYEHRTKAVHGFTRRHGLDTLVYYETYEDIETAIAREKTLKGWRRNWKLRLIIEMNPEWRDFYEEILR